MQRIAEVGGLFIAGNPATNTKGTVVTAAWLNAIQEEIARAIEIPGIALDSGSNEQLSAAIDAMITARLSFIGTVQFFAMSAPPTGWLKCNGSAVSRTVYAALFSSIGTVYGVGNGTSTFNLPDLRGEFLRGWDDGRGVDSGRVLGSSQADDFKSHTHTYNGDTLVGLGGTGTNVYANFTGPTSATGGAETRPRNVALLVCIKY